MWISRKDYESLRWVVSNLQQSNLEKTIQIENLEDDFVTLLNQNSNSIARLNRLIDHLGLEEVESQTVFEKKK